MTVRVHPISLQAAPIGIPSDPLQAKFSIPYTTAFTLLHGPPGVADFRVLDDEALRLSKGVEVRADPALDESEAVMEGDCIEPVRVRSPLGSPERPMDGAALRAKIRSLAGDDLERLFLDGLHAAALVHAVIVRPG